MQDAQAGEMGASAMVRYPAPAQDARGHERFGEGSVPLTRSGAPSAAAAERAYRETSGRRLLSRETASACLRTRIRWTMRQH